MTTITKTQALAMLGGSAKTAAHAIGCTVQAVHKWPDVLSARIADRVIAAQTRLQKPRKRKTAEVA